MELVIHSQFQFNWFCIKVLNNNIPINKNFFLPTLPFLFILLFCYGLTSDNLKQTLLLNLIPAPEYGKQVLNKAMFLDFKLSA